MAAISNRPAGVLVRLMWVAALATLASAADTHATANARGSADAWAATRARMGAGKQAASDPRAGATSQVTIDRVLAIVDSAVITLSDARALVALGVVKVGEGQDPVRVALDHGIDRQLMLNEVERYSAPEPDPEYVDLRLAAIRARFPSTESFQAALARVGLTLTSLRARLRDDLRIEQYMRDRFSAVIDPTEDEMRRYYEEHRADFTRGGVVASYEEVAALVRDNLVERRREDVISDWVERLRRQAIVTDLYGSSLAVPVPPEAGKARSRSR